MENKKIVIDYKKFENADHLKKLFTQPFESLENSNILLPSEIPNLFNVVLSFDELLTKLKERAKFQNSTFITVKKNKIVYYQNKIKYLKSIKLENEGLEVKRNLDIIECELKIKNIELSKQYKTFNLSEDGEILSLDEFNIIKVIRDMQNIISQNALSPATRIKLQNCVTAPASSETLKDIILGALRKENEENIRKTNIQKN